MSRFTRWTATLAAGAALSAALLVSPDPAAAADGPASRADLALGWLADELDAGDGVLSVSFDGTLYPDQGLTIDAILAEVAGGHGGDPSVVAAVDAVDAILGSYTGTDFAESYAGATAKSLLLQEVLDEDLGGSVDLEADLRALLTTSGPEQGRFKDVSPYGDFSNGIGQALAILALDRTAAGVPVDAVTWLLAQQCTDGSFRLYYPEEPAGVPYACHATSEGDTDATAVALSALLTQPSSPTVAGAITDAVDALVGQQQSGGGFLGTGAVNANSTGLASAALRAAGDGAVADGGAAFVAGLQITDCADVELGAIAYGQPAFDAGVDADRGQWARAAAQGSLALGLPDYAGIGSVAPVDVGLTGVDCTPAPPAPTKPTVSLSSGSVVAGGSLTVTATGFGPAETVGVSLHSTPLALGTAVADPQGQAVKVVTIPSELEPGVHTVTVLGESSGATASATVEVTAPTEDPQALPATGSDALPEALLGLGFVLVGAGTVLLGHTRRARLAPLQDR